MAGAATAYAFGFVVLMGLFLILLRTIGRVGRCAVDGGGPFCLGPFGGATTKVSDAPKERPGRTRSAPLPENR